MFSLDLWIPVCTPNLALRFAHLSFYSLILLSADCMPGAGLGLEMVSLLPSEPRRPSSAEPTFCPHRADPGGLPSTLTESCEFPWLRSSSLSFAKRDALGTRVESSCQGESWYPEAAQGGGMVTEQRSQIWVLMQLLL